jgi:hypothetical protein
MLQKLILPLYFETAGGRGMGDEKDPASLAEYYDAFKQLCENGYIEHDRGVLFRLTADGFKKDSKLK